MKLNITWKIFIGMLLGIAVGYGIHSYLDLGQFGIKDATLLSPAQVEANEKLKDWSSFLQLLSKIFLRMIQMILGPLVFSILAVGIAKF
jgi:Na+/H+-dicarboxylate symporter